MRPSARPGLYPSQNSSSPARAAMPASRHAKRKSFTVDPAVIPKSASNRRAAASAATACKLAKQSRCRPATPPHLWHGACAHKSNPTACPVMALSAAHVEMHVIPGQFNFNCKLVGEQCLPSIRRYVMAVANVSPYALYRQWKSVRYIPKNPTRRDRRKHESMQRDCSRKARKDNPG